MADFHGQVLGLLLDRGADGTWTVNLPGMAEHVRIDTAARQHAIWLEVDDLAIAQDRLAAHRETRPIQVTPESLILHEPDGIASHLVDSQA